MVNIWQNNTTDSTGYTTRYEVNTHTDEGVEYSPVVDYDGGFYPPAVKSYVLNPEEAYRSVRDGATSKSIVQKIRSEMSHINLSALYAIGADALRDGIYEKTSSYIEPYYQNSGYRSIVNNFVNYYTF